MPVNVEACSGESMIESPAEHVSHSAGSEPLAVRTINLSWISIVSSLLFPMISLAGSFHRETWKECLKVPVTFKHPLSRDRDTSNRYCRP